MKKLWAVILVSALLLSCVCFSTAAEDATTVTVTIAVAGELTVMQKTVTVVDSDADGARTISDALTAVHEAAYEGGAAAGYGTAKTQYGVSIVKLWGDESGNFGYYVNNASAWSLLDPVKNGDSVYAYVYADSTGYSDMYTYFDKNTVRAKAEDEITLTLFGASFDAGWNPITVPVAGATITVDGKATEAVTDAEGKVTLALENGAHIISATSDTQVLVPPVCAATIKETAVQEPEPEKIPQTGVESFVPMVVFALSGAALLMGVSRKAYEK